MNKIKYLNIAQWNEHRMPGIFDLDFVYKIANFIDEATFNYSSCLIVSNENKCCSILTAIIYLMIKFKWTALRSIDFMNSKKSDIEITKLILKSLKILENKIHSKMIKRFKIAELQMRNDWHIENTFCNRNGKIHLSLE